VPELASVKFGQQRCKGCFLLTLHIPIHTYRGERNCPAMIAHKQ
jgi:hypothetical protein